MSTEELKTSIQKLIEQTNDSLVLEAYYEILQKLVNVQQSQTIGYTSDGEPISTQGLEQGIDKARDRMNKGNSVGMDELEQDFKNW